MRVLHTLPEDASALRSDIHIAISSFDGLLTGDTEHLADVTTTDLTRLLENTKHLAKPSS